MNDDIGRLGCPICFGFGGTVNSSIGRYSSRRVDFLFCRTRVEAFLLLRADMRGTRRV